MDILTRMHFDEGGMQFGRNAGVDFVRFRKCRKTVCEARMEQEHVHKKAEDYHKAIDEQRDFTIREGYRHMLCFAIGGMPGGADHDGLAWHNTLSHPANSCWQWLRKHCPDGRIRHGH